MGCGNPNTKNARETFEVTGGELFMDKYGHATERGRNYADGSN